MAARGDPGIIVRTFEDIDCAFPSNLSEALALLGDEATRGKLLAGGTDLMVQWESGSVDMPVRAISVKSLPELLVLKIEGAHVSIGAAVTHWDLRAAPVVRDALPSLAAAAATVGGRQIQMMGTIGGSIANASPAGDLAPALLADDASVVVASAARGERVMTMESFLLGYRKIDLQPDELIVRFEVPVRKEGEKEGFRKLGPRAAQAISKIMGNYRGAIAGDGTVTLFRVALGSVAETAVRLHKVEDAVTGQALNDGLIAEAERIASDSIKPISDIRSTADYRKWVGGRLIRGFLEDLKASPSG